MNTSAVVMEEKSFHDRWANEINTGELLVDEYFEAVTAIENKYILNQFGDLKGKRILDIGCGAGESSIYFAKKGALVTAVDVSSGMLEITNKLALRENVDIQTVKACAEELPFEDCTFDFIYGNGVLHHTNHSDTLIEVKRVLKPFGMAAFIEPLAHNPLINIYRKKAAGVRTKNEKPFSIKQIETMCKLFEEPMQHKEFWLLSLWVFIKFYLHGINPEKERYWKKVIYDADKIKNTFTLLNKIDNKLLMLPFIRRYCWNTVLIAKK